MVEACPDCQDVPQPYHPPFKLASNMQIEILNKVNIQAKTDEYELLNYYLKPYHQNGKLKQGQNISNPFLAEKQKTPSFNIYPVSSGNHWRYKDFATSDEGDIFDLVMKLKHCDFKDALSVINQDFQLGLEPNPSPVFDMSEKEQWSDSELDCWKQYGITSCLLNSYKVKNLLSYTTTNKQGKKFTVYASRNDPIFAYQTNNGEGYKIYRPHSKKYKFSWLGAKPTSYYFGYQQLPPAGKLVFITGGEKDVLSLAANGYPAISCNSETAIPSPEIVKKLKERFQNITVLYDIDETGKHQSEKLCRLYGLSRIMLPSKLTQANGKDIADFFKLGHSLDDLLGKQEKFKQELNSEIAPVSNNLEILLSTQKVLQENKSKPITFSKPILKQDEQAVFYPRTINVLQGKAGVHKSRLAETICSAVLKRVHCKNDLLGFKANILNPSTVCYVDTERNLSEQLPYALQQIQLKAGYTIEDKPYNFDFISLLEIPRNERFKTLTEYLEYVREKYRNHILIVLDVITDCIKDFNRPEDSMQLIDLMNEVINRYNVTFLCLIHENPGSADKARGHLGTEIMNKASTAIQVSFEKGKNGEPTDLVCVKYLKCRNSKKHQSFHIEYNSFEKGLVLADESTIAEVVQSRKQKADLAELSEHLQLYLNEPMTSSELIEQLTKDFNCSDRIIRERLKELIQTKCKIVDNSGTPCQLSKGRSGKEILYSLVPNYNGTMENSLEG